MPEHRQAQKSKSPAEWKLWRESGNPEGTIATNNRRDGKVAFRFRCSSGERIALVQNVRVPADVSVRVTGWLKALNMDGGSAHIRCNFKEETVYTNRVQKKGDWRQVHAEIEPLDNANPGDLRTIRLHVFLERGAGEVLWDDIKVTAVGYERNFVRNGSFEIILDDGRNLDFWSLVNSIKEVPAGNYSLNEDAIIGISGRHKNGCTLFPIGGFAVLRNSPVVDEATALLLTFGPYGSGHSHPDMLHFSLYSLDEVLLPDAGSWGYSNPMHLTWANQTIAHNTLTIDRVSQQPQGNSDSIWASERGEQRVYGVVQLFHSGSQMKLVRATSNTAYENVILACDRRWLCYACRQRPAKTC